MCAGGGGGPHGIREVVLVTGGDAAAGGFGAERAPLLDVLQRALAAAAAVAAARAGRARARAAARAPRVQGCVVHVVLGPEGASRDWPVPRGGILVRGIPLPPRPGPRSRRRRRAPARTSAYGRGFGHFETDGLTGIYFQGDETKRFQHVVKLIVIAVDLHAALPRRKRLSWLAVRSLVAEVPSNTGPTGGPRGGTTP